jgi:hypothetical protein
MQTLMIEAVDVAVRDAHTNSFEKMTQHTHGGNFNAAATTTAAAAATATAASSWPSALGFRMMYDHIPAAHREKFVRWLRCSGMSCRRWCSLSSFSCK